jgi:formate C-acetyltransferase
MDSRKDGEPFGKNAGAVLKAIKNTPTDLITSASKLPQHRYSGGVPIDIYVVQNILQNKENKDKFKGILRSYFRMGGMQVQVNSVGIELLKRAYEHPEEHPHVIVRKGGFSIYFTDMLREVQKDMIDRFEMEVKH